MDEIRPRLWLGSYSAASDRAALAERGVTHVLTVGVKVEVLGSRQRILLPPSEKDPLCRLVIAVQDVPSARLDRHFDACSAFISEALAQGGAVLVHCQAGQSRSPTVVAAHLMREERLPAAGALDGIRKRRPMVQPNTGFMDQLRALELRLGTGEAAAGFSADTAGAPVPGVMAQAQAEDEGEASEIDGEGAGEEEPQEALQPESRAATATKAAADVFGTEELRLRSDALRARYQQLRASNGLLALAAPLRKRRQLAGHRDER